MRFKISILLNVVLLGSLVLILINEGKDPTPPVIALQPQPAASEPMTKEHGAATFQWNQLESRDYGQYEANLRAIGCPEPIIRDIILGNAKRDLAAKQQSMQPDEAKSAELEQAGAGTLGVAQPAPTQAITAEQLPVTLQKLAALSQAIKETTVPVQQPPFPVDTMERIAYFAGLRNPAASQQANSGTLKLTDNQRAAITQLQDQAAASTGTANGSSENGGAASGNSGSTPSHDQNQVDSNPNRNEQLRQIAQAQARARAFSDDALRGVIGSQGAMNYFQEIYDNNFADQLPGGGPINPTTLALPH